jgi:hypothetical protein
MREGCGLHGYRKSDSKDRRHQTQKPGDEVEPPAPIKAPVGFINSLLLGEIGILDKECRLEVSSVVARPYEGDTAA